MGMGRCYKLVPTPEPIVKHLPATLHSTPHEGMYEFRFWDSQKQVKAREFKMAREDKVMAHGSSWERRAN